MIPGYQACCSSGGAHGLSLGNSHCFNGSNWWSANQHETHIWIYLVEVSTTNYYGFVRKIMKIRNIWFSKSPNFWFNQLSMLGFNEEI